MQARRRRPAVLHSVFERAFHEQRRALLGWGVGLSAFGLAMLAIFPTMRGNTSFQKLLEHYPKALQSMFGLADYTTGPGYLRSEVFSFTAPLLLIILAVLWGSDVTAGEEERGSIDILLANPISRRRVVLEKWGAVAAGLTLVSAVFGVVLVAGDSLFAMHVGLVPLVAALVATLMLALLFATLALAIAAATGHRAAARGVTAVLAVSAYLVSTLSPVVSWLHPVRPVSPWYQALGVDPISSGLSWHVLVLVALVLALGGSAALAFDRRDLAVS